MTMGAGLRPEAKAEDEPPDPTVRAPVLDPTGRGRLEKCPATGNSLAAYLTHTEARKATVRRFGRSH